MGNHRIQKHLNTSDGSSVSNYIVMIIILASASEVYGYRSSSDGVIPDSESALCTVPTVNHRPPATAFRSILY